MTKLSILSVLVQLSVTTSMLGSAKSPSKFTARCRFCDVQTTVRSTKDLQLVTFFPIFLNNSAFFCLLLDASLNNKHLYFSQH